MSRSSGFHIEHVPTRTHTPRSDDRRSTIDDKKQALSNPASIPGSNLLNRNTNITDILAGLPKPPTWHDDSTCATVGGDIWFPEQGESHEDAKQICAGCPVINECLKWALDNHERYGVYGGKSAHERNLILRQRVVEVSVA